jgi:hypothetical protein
MTGVMLRVQSVVMPSGAKSATLVRDGVVVDPADRFLAHLTAIERSPKHGPGLRPRSAGLLRFPRLAGP